MSGYASGLGIVGVPVAQANLALVRAFGTPAAVAEAEIGVAKAAYVRDEIDIYEFENLVGGILQGDLP